MLNGSTNLFYYLLYIRIFFYKFQIVIFLLSSYKMWTKNLTQKIVFHEIPSVIIEEINLHLI